MHIPSFTIFIIFHFYSPIPLSPNKYHNSQDIKMIVAMLYHSYSIKKSQFVLKDVFKCLAKVKIDMHLETFSCNRYFPLETSGLIFQDHTLSTD